jgi:hypothetical protein
MKANQSLSASPIKHWDDAQMVAENLRPPKLFIDYGAFRKTDSEKKEYKLRKNHDQLGKWPIKRAEKQKLSARFIVHLKNVKKDKTFHTTKSYKCTIEEAGEIITSLKENGLLILKAYWNNHKIL